MSDSVKEAYRQWKDNAIDDDREAIEEYNGLWISEVGFNAGYQAATAAADEKYRTIMESMQRWIDFHNERADKADAEWRGMVEKLANLLTEADEALDGEGVYAAPNCDLYKRIEQALAQAEQLMGRK